MPITPFMGVRYLVAHVGEEVALRTAGRHRLLARRDQVLGTLLDLGLQLARVIGDPRALRRDLIGHDVERVAHPADLVVRRVL
jgi:hypothetical protein